MNQKEINELKKNFSDDCGFFTVNRVVTAFVDTEKNIKCKTNQIYSIIEQDESEFIMINLKKILSGTIGKNLLEYQFPKNAYLEGEAQPFFYEVLQSRFTDDEVIDKFLNNIVEKMDYVSNYTIFSAHCTYSVLKKNKNDDFEEEADHDYNFIITAICPVNLRIDGLIYNEENNAIAKKESSDRIVELPSDGFLFPLFSNRTADVNGVLYYTKNAKKPNTSIVNELLGCEFVMSSESEKETFQAILNNVVGDELDYDVINTINEKIQELVNRNSNETEIPTIDSHKLSSILWEAGVSQDKLENLSRVYENEMGDKPLTAVNLVKKKTVINANYNGITISIDNGNISKVEIKTTGNKHQIIIDVEDDVSVNGFEVGVKKNESNCDEKQKEKF